VAPVRRERPSRTATKIARFMLLLDAVPRLAPVLPAGSARAVEAILRGSGSVPQRHVDMMRSPRTVRFRFGFSDRVRVYRKPNGDGGLAPSSDDEAAAADPRDYDAEYYVRLLASTYAERLARAFTAEDFGIVFADADQLTLFSPSVQSIRPVLRMLALPDE
jgi:hypothetical protein